MLTLYFAPGSSSMAAHIALARDRRPVRGSAALVRAQGDAHARTTSR